MRIHLPCTAVGLALAAVAPAAHAETIVTRHIVSQPVETVRTVTTTRTTTRTIHPAVRRAAVVTRRTTVGERVAPVAPVPAIAAAPPIYDAAGPAPVPYPEPVYDVEAPVTPAPIVNAYPRPVYDVGAPAPAIVAPVVDETIADPAVPVPPDAAGPPMPTFHYVYEWDRILVIDDATGIAVQALPR